MPTLGKILIVEDEEAIVHVLVSILSANGYTALVAKNGSEALLMASSHIPDAILLDLGLPGDLDGVDVLKKLRQWYGKPVLIVSARDQETEKVEALDLGADDYITKPFGSSELIARIRAALRNSVKKMSGDDLPATSYSVGDFTIDFDKHTVTVDGESVHLTQIEFKIVELLARQLGKVLTYGYIQSHIWGPFFTEDNKILRVNMAHIRRKIEKNPAEPQYILTEMGLGYRMAENPDQD